MGAVMKALCVLVLVAAAASPLQAQIFPQILPWNVSVDSSLRMEFLFGTQVIRHKDFDQEFSAARYRFNFDPRLPILAGTVELTPMPWISGRLAGSMSAFETSAHLYRTTEPFAARYSVKPQFRSWEAAGLLHLWNGGGYRFSLTGGYRQHLWQYRGDSEGLGGPSQPSRDNLTSHIPFLGLQTAMYFPWWKARFEILGSTFMRKDTYSAIQQTGNFVEFTAKADRGGILELQMEGTVALTPNIRVGLYGSYTYEELFGTLWGSGNGTPFWWGADVWMHESFAVAGLDLTIVF